jgi:hypothetical protein
MQNLEQVRARNALAFAKSGAVKGDQGGEVIKKVSPLIMNHGLLATAAYSFSEKEGWQKVFDAITTHLADPAIAILPYGASTRDKLMECLTAEDATSELLKLATAEAMAWLTYARRFVRKTDPARGA